MALSHALLSALLRDPCTGYDLAGRFDGSVGFFWKATHQQIYRELSSMEAEGWLQSEVQAQSGRPDKKVYQVTPSGRETLAAWIESSCPVATYKDELLVKLFAGPVTSIDKVMAEVSRHHQAHQERLAEYRHIEQRFFTDSEALPISLRWQYMTLRCGIRIETTWVEWLEEALAELGRDAAAPHQTC